MASQEESVREFVAVTDVDEERARFFLESAGWNLQLALASFFEDGADDDIVTLPQPEGGSSVSRSAGPSQPRVTSFRDLMHEAEDESDEEEGQRFFAGGSERSGQQIVGPPKKKSPNEVVEDLFKGAREHGAVPLDRAGKGPGESSKAKAFVGGGYRLGAAPEEESAYVAGERQASNSQQDVHVVLKLWKTGFSLDNGELRNYNDPGNANFLDAIRRGEIPLELRQRSRGGQVNLDMEDHRDEDFVKPKMAFKAFGGEGQKLGSATPELISAPPTSQQDQSANEAQASASVTLDPSQPTTNIQIRLADGGRLVQKFNHTHRVSDLRQFVVTARPAMAAREFALMTTFPNKELSDENQTLQQANLLNAVIVQQLK
ncbi:NSFL1 cofactor p47 isoform X2 [Melanotaenia boesemani]|uniref:NSFL1 cofactor p47 isoform X2 n=1 Tax=Melanotaenia boesemani TaxID=1250792 RepID=UPI001C05374F|nr:NSFL1 cofactor p47 isoform X2 [Melanotaenia boesemani]